jgi:hypothetical protein
LGRRVLTGGERRDDGEPRRGLPTVAPWSLKRGPALSTPCEAEEARWRRLRQRLPKGRFGTSPTRLSSRQESFERPSTVEAGSAMRTHGASAKGKPQHPTIPVAGIPVRPEPNARNSRRCKSRVDHPSMTVFTALTRTCLATARITRPANPMPISNVSDYAIARRSICGPSWGSLCQ